MSEYARHQGRTGRVLLNLFLALLLLLGATWGAFYFWSAGALDRQMEKSAALGFPMTLQEMDAWYAQPPANDDATEFYLAALPLLQAQALTPEKMDLLPIVGQADPLPPTEPIPVEVKEALKEYLQAYGEAGDLLLKGAQRTRARYPIDFLQGPAMELSHLAGLRQGCRLLALAAIVEAEDGNPPQAGEYVQASLRVGESLAEEPILISHLVRIACHGISVEALRQVLNRAALSEEQLAGLQAAFADVEGRDTFYRALVGERAMGNSYFDMTSQDARLLGQNPSVFGGVPGGLYKATGLGNVDRAFYVKSMDGMVAAAQAPIDQRLAAAERLQQGLGDPGPTHLLSSLLLPSLVRSVEANIRDVAYLRCARTALAIERYRLAHGEVPPSLQALVGEYLEAVPNDPYLGQPLRYAPSNTGYVIYSFGEDRQDDNGLDVAEASRQKMNGREADVSIRVERQP